MNRTSPTGRWAAGLSGVLAVAALAVTVPGVPAGAAAPKVVTPDFAGYEASLTASSVTYSGDVKLPTVTCTSADTHPLLLDETVDSAQTGVVTQIDVGIECSDTTPVYGADISVNGTLTSVKLHIKARTKLAFAVHLTSSATTATLRVVATGKSVTAHGGGGTPKGLAISAGSLGQSDFPRFSHIRFRAITVNGSPLSALSPVRFNEGTKVPKEPPVIDIKAGKLNSAGNGFNDIYKSNVL